jgi:hypothetical protein
MYRISTSLLKVLRRMFHSHFIMDLRTNLALAGLAMLSLSAVSIIGLSKPSSVHAPSLQSDQNGNTTVTIVKNNNDNTLQPMT